MESQLENALKIKDSSIQASHRLGKVELYYDNDGFHLLKDGKEHLIKKYYLDPALHKMSCKHLKAFQDAGYFSVNEIGNDEFSIRVQVRGLGGGPVTGAALYWLTKTLCYGTALAGVGTAIAVTGGGAAGVVAGGCLAASGAAVTGSATVAMVGVGGAITTQV